MHYLTFQQSLETGTIISFRNGFSKKYLVQGYMGCKQWDETRTRALITVFSRLILISQHWGLFRFWSLRLALVALALPGFGLKTQRADIRFDCHTELRRLPQELFAVDPTTGSQGLKDDEVLYKCRKCR